MDHRASSPRRDHRVAVLTALAAGTVMTAGLFSPTSAPAAFAGENGMIAFSSDRDGNSEIYVMDAEGNGQTNLTHNPADDRSPAVSPDGQRIAFTSDRDGDDEIWVMNADGTDPRRLTNNATNDFEPSFSADGSRIVFSTDRHDYYEIYVMNANGTGQIRLTHGDVDLLSSSGPRFSPDGLRIVFDRSLDIWAMDADGSNQTQLTEDPEEDASPSFSPDGSKIVFMSARDGFDEFFYDIYVMDADGANQTRLTPSVASDLAPVYSPDGSRIAFTRIASGNPEVYVMGADGSDPTNLTGNAANDGAPDWGVRDSVPPQTRITRKPALRTASHLARFEFTGDDRATRADALTFRCRLDSATWRSCASPKTYRALKPGRHAFRVRVTDGAGNTDASPATHAWRITRSR